MTAPPSAGPRPRPGAGPHEADADARTARRIKVFVPGHLGTASGDLRVHMLNVSIRGAMLHVTRPLAPGEHVSLAAGALHRDASVAWCQRDRIGIRFLAPLAELPTP